MQYQDTVVIIHFICILSNTFIDRPTVTNIRNVSTICVTYLNISWDPPSITCGDVSYEVSVAQPPIEVIPTVNTFLSITGLNNSLPDVTITVTASNRAGQGDDRIFIAQLPPSKGKYCTCKCSCVPAIITFAI